LPITADAKSSATTSTAPPPVALPKGNGKSILIVDDEEDILELVRQTLQSQGYQIQTALDGELALEHLGKGSFDLIVSDWKMPGVNGQQLYQRLQASNPVAAKRMIFMTGDVLSDKVERYLQEEGKTCLHKPFSLVDFHRAIGKVLGNN
jgi:CheY-like chemotaxis protein